MMAPDPDPKQVVRSFYAEVINDRDLDALDSLLAEDFQHNGDPRGRAGQRRAVAAFLAGFSDLRHEILLMIAEGDFVSAYQSWTGTHDGEFMGRAPTGRSVSFTSTAILQVRGNQIARAWDVIDMALVNQLA